MPMLSDVVDVPAITFTRSVRGSPVAEDLRYRLSGRMEPDGTTGPPLLIVGETRRSISQSAANVTGWCGRLPAPPR